MSQYNRRKCDKMVKFRRLRIKTKPIFVIGKRMLLLLLLLSLLLLLMIFSPVIVSAHLLVLITST